MYADVWKFFLQELQEQLSREKDLRQHELSSLQDAHAHKLTQLRKKHREEVAELRAKIQEMDWGSEGWETQVRVLGRQSVRICDDVSRILGNILCMFFYLNGSCIAKVGNFCILPSSI